MSNNESDMDEIQPQLMSLQSLFSSCYQIPIYQRPYSWDANNQLETLLNDIIEAYKSYKGGKDTEDYYTGNIILYDTGHRISSYQKFEIIDGQQRIATFALILLAMYTKLIIDGVDTSKKNFVNIRTALWCTVDDKPHKDYPKISLNGIGAKCFSDLYLQCFDEPKTILKFCDQYNCKSTYDGLIINNFTYIYEYICKFVRENTGDQGISGILDFSDYILKNIKFVSISISFAKNKAFSIFESINAKGKALDQIDLIKSYIFSMLDNESSGKYLDIWGNLIIETNDKLEEYLQTYIRAFYKFYSNKITVVSFRGLCESSEFKRYFKTDNEADTIKKLLEDMYDKVKFYKMLSSTNEACKLVNKRGRFRFYYEVFVKSKYEYCKAPFMRLLYEKNVGHIEGTDVEKVVSALVCYMIKFSAAELKPKVMGDTVSNIMDYIYDTDMSVKGEFSTDSVIYIITQHDEKMGIQLDSIKSKMIEKYDYNNNSVFTTAALLALFKSTTTKDNGQLKTSYDQAYEFLNSCGSVQQLDHLLVQTPKEDDGNLKYYEDVESKTLKLKEGHDFPDDKVFDGMDYEEFKKICLHPIGNLDFKFGDKNAGRRNSSLSSFNTYSQIVERSQNIVDTVVDFCLLYPKFNLKKVNVDKKKTRTTLPTMKDLMENGLIKKGDRLYIINSNDIEASEATIIDDKNVEFNGERLTFNDWGCKVQGWQSIDIYLNAAIVGENETLDQKRYNLYDPE